MISVIKDKFIQIINSLYYRFPRSLVRYMVKWNDRQIIDIGKMLDDELQSAIVQLRQIISDNSLLCDDQDKTVIKCLAWVRGNLSYVSDKIQYKDVEYWASITEILSSMMDDCEGGAKLVYMLCRAAGVPKEQLNLCAGDVVGGGHCWVSYVSINYPYVYYFLDWCYWYDTTKISKRTAYLIEDNGNIIPDTKYKKLWFLVNEDGGTTWE